MADIVIKSAFLIVSVSFLWCAETSPTFLRRMASDNLKPGDMLNATTKLCSSAGIFCMQFQKDDNGFSYLTLTNDYRYAAQWYGNRNEPIVDNSAALTLDYSGELKIISQSQGKSIKVFYSPIRPINNIKAILLDNGNFVLEELHSNGSKKSVLWQSYDYPTDTLLPEMKLGVNHKTGHNWSLVSFISQSDIPAPGDFTLEWEPKRRELLIRGRELVYWRSGVLINNESFENIPKELMHPFVIVSNEDEDYFALRAPKSNRELLYWRLNPDGSLYDGKRAFVWTHKCLGPNNDGGCQIYDLPACWHSGLHVETLPAYINLTDIETLKYVKNDTNSSLTGVDCRQRCWSNCDCVGFSTANANRTGCTFLYKNAPVFTSIHPSDNVKLVQMNTLNGRLHHKGKKRWIWIGVVIAASLFTVCLSILCLALKNRKIQLKETKRQNSQTAMPDILHSNEFTNVSDLQEEIENGHDVRVFSYACVVEATNDFSSENKLGEGGFGPVYKGMLSTGKEIAIKSLSRNSEQGVVEFKNELTLICELQHMNLVQLLGYCIHKEDRMLIYEFMPNKSLDFFLFDSTQSKLLDWQKRFNIIEGIAQGLVYLHKYSRLKVIHRDLKASNILLDENLNPKISDFGMARMFKQHESEANTNRIVGTYGYMSPEYAMDGIFSAKSDVYSFGILLLEIVSGRRNNTFYCDDGSFSIVGHAWKLWKEGATLQLMDPILIDSHVHNEVLRCIHIGILCVEEDVDDRPTMSNIVSMLTNQSAVLSSPKRPAFNTRRRMIEVKSSSKESDINSINEVTLSMIDAR